MQSQRWQFGDFQLDIENAGLWHHDQRLSLRPKSFDLLVYLVTHPNQLLSKETLLDSVWPDTIVTDAVLKNGIRELRKVLGESAHSPRFIATEHRRGYRFIADVTEWSETPSSSTALAEPTDDILEAQEATSPEPSRSGATGRRQLTILYCDLVIASTLAKTLDPEDYLTLIREFQDACTRAIEPFGGFLAQRLGSGMLVYFGYPAAQEDAGYRAVSCGLKLLTMIEAFNSTAPIERHHSLAIRVGIHSGLVVLGHLGEDSDADHVAIGVTPEVAMQLAERAEPNTVAISTEIVHATQGYFVTERLTPLNQPGRKDLPPAYRVLSESGVQTRLGVASQRGLSPFVGRVVERALLTERWSHVQEGRGQVVTLVGEAGIGKSRLLLEFRQQIGQEAVWLEGQALSIGQVVTFHPLIGLFKHFFHIQPHDTEAVMIAKIETLSEPLGRDLDASLPYIRDLLALDPGNTALQTIDPELRRSELFDAMRRLLIRAAERQPHILVIEDLHWMDHATESFLLALIDHIPTCRIMCVFTYRPGYASPFSERTYSSRITMSSLSVSDSLDLTQQILERETLPETLKTLITQKTEGNPLFIEEILQSIQETGELDSDQSQLTHSSNVHESNIPGTIRDLLMARIDRLGDGAKQTLQLAAVIGREFTYQLLSQLSLHATHLDQYLQELKSLELIYEKSSVSDSLYLFKHALTQDVAYNSLLRQQRRELHRDIGQALETLYAERLPEQYEVLAHHFTRGQVWHKALEFVLKSARKASRTLAAREAFAYYDQALDLTSKIEPEQRIQATIEIRQAKASLHFSVGDFERASAEGQELLGLSSQTTIRGLKGPTLVNLGWAAIYAHQFDQALSYACQARSEGTQHQMPAVVAGSDAVAGFVKMLTGQLEQARVDMHASLTGSPATDNIDHSTIALYANGMLKNFGGQYREAIQYQQEGIALARQHQLASPLIRHLFVHGITLTAYGRYDEALAALDEGLAQSKKIGNRLYYYRILNSIGRLYLDLGDFHQALDFNQRSAEGARERGDPEILANAELNIADTYLEMGDVQRAAPILNGVERLVQSPSTSNWLKWRYAMHLYASLGAYWLSDGDLSQAQDFVNECQTLALDTQSQKYVAQAGRLQSSLLLGQGQHDAAEQYLLDAIKIADTIGNVTQSWKAYVALGQLYMHNNQVKPAQRAYEKAYAVVVRIERHCQEPRLSASLEQASFRQQIIELVQTN